MSKNKVFIAGLLVVIMVSGMVFTGCATSKHSVAITYAGGINIREVYIRNAGASGWGANLIKDLDDINKSLYSSTVDIRVVDTSGIVYNKYNVSFDDSVFIETGKTTSMNKIALGALCILFGGGALAVGILLL